jgi:IclR family transcriptional regulator, acetate operon repressor
MPRDRLGCPPQTARATADPAPCGRFHHVVRPISLAPEIDWGVPSAARSAAGEKALLAALDDDALRELYADDVELGSVADIDRLVREMRAIRALGYATAIDEVEIGLSSVAVCLRDTSGAPVGAVVIALPTSRLRPFIDCGNLTNLHESAVRMERSISERVPPDLLT